MSRPVSVHEVCRNPAIVISRQETGDEQDFFAGASLANLLVSRRVHRVLVFPAHVSFEAWTHGKSEPAHCW